MLKCKIGNQEINCFDDKYSKEQLKNWSKKNILKCPSCGKTFEYCHGKIIPPYFRHKDKVICNDLYGELETKEHIVGKMDLYNWLLNQKDIHNIVLEGYLEKTHQKPDIMFDFNNKKCVIEFQCSPISSEYIERHELYRASGIYDLWICGTQKYIQQYHKGSGDKRINTLEESCGLYYNYLTKEIYEINNINESEFKSILNKKQNVNLMYNELDYSEGYKNFLFIKDSSKNYSSYHYYPSGRPSNKYPYPITKYKYDTNLSLARCYKLKNIKLKEVN